MNLVSRFVRPRLLAGLSALLLGAGGLALSAGAGAAHAALCLPTGYVQDGINLTAALQNPPDATVPENLDATGCDIGIYYTSGPHTLSAKHVFGSRYYGILATTGTAAVAFDAGSIYDVGNDPKDGTQHGVAVAYRNGATGSVTNSQLYDYQKGALVADGAGTTVTVQNNTIRGLGPVTFIAQNGVQLSRGAAGHVNNNFIKDHEYTGCSKANQKAGTCTPYVSAGILLYQVDPAVVDTNNNLFRNNDVNLLNASNAS